MPFFQQALAIIIGGFCGVLQPLGSISVHAGLARIGAQAPALRLREKRIHAFGVDRGIGTNRRGAIGKRQIKVTRGNLGSIGRIGKAHFLGKGVGVQPINQPLAPTRDDRGLRVMHMGIDKARTDQRLPVVDDLGLWIITRSFYCGYFTRN